MGDIDLDAFDWSQLDEVVPCDGGDNKPAAWLVTWATPRFKCGRCYGNQMLCQDHFAIIANAVRNGAQCVCHCDKEVGLMSELIKKAEPL